MAGVRKNKSRVAKPLTKLQIIMPESTPKRKARVLIRSARQTGVSNMARDKNLKALSPGKRRSKTGNIYYERRRNRSDIKGVDTPIKKRKIIKHVKITNVALARSVKGLTLFKEPLRGIRRHALLPLHVRKKLPKIYSQENTKNPIVYLKLFSPYSRYTLYVTEFDGKDTLFGYVTGSNNNEWGYASFNKLATAAQGGLPLIERDMHFSPKKFNSIIQK
jgi:hypothetical protein